MKIEIGAVTAALAADYMRLTDTGKLTLSATPTSNVARYPIVGGSTQAWVETTTVGSASNGLTTVREATDVLIGKDGSRTTAITLSGFSYDFLGGLGSSLDSNTFWTGVTALVDGRAPGATFESRFLSGNDEILGSAYANTLTGGAGNDRMAGKGGADTIDGGTGSDVSVYRELARSDYLVTRLSNNTVFVATKDGTTDRNVNIESLEFNDGTVAVGSIPYLPGHTAVPISAVQPVFRFYNARDKAFFYTTSASERDMIIRESTDASFTPGNGLWPYFYQGATFEQAHSTPGSTAVYRFYNTKTGHHFFTTSPTERDVVLRESTDPSFGQPGLWPFAYEGEALRAYADPNHRDAAPVFRFYSPSLDRHFFTGNAEEAAQVRLTGVWQDEGIGYWGETAG